MADLLKREMCTVSIILQLLTEGCRLFDGTLQTGSYSLSTMDMGKFKWGKQTSECSNFIKKQVLTLKCPPGIELIIML